jgi:phenylacetate-coenzyme A ligase PaaK-like adenylate-forming protein
MWEGLRFGRQVEQLIAWSRRPPGQVLAIQHQRLRQLVRYACARSPFYRQRFRNLDLDRCRLTDLPPLTKAEMMAHFDDVVTDRRITRVGVEHFLADRANLGHCYLGRYAVCHTSGSQGQPALVIQERWDMLRAFAQQVARGQALPRPWTKLVSRLWRPARLAVITQRFGFYPSGATFAYLARARLPFLRLLRLSVFDSGADLAARLNAFRPDFVVGYTSALESLARLERDGPLRLRQSGCLRQVTNISEPLPPSSRAFIEQAFGVHMTDTYALAECLALSSGCPHATGAHLNADLACLEVVDDHYRAVPAGVAGSKVLVTNLYNRVQPLIRYEVGDVVTLSPSRCPCGSPLPLIQSVTGRTKERFWVEAGGRWRELPYYVFLAALHHCLEMAEHQVLQTGRNHFVLRAVPLPGKMVSAERLKQLVDESVRQEGLAGLIDLDVQIVEEIKPDPRSGKMQRVRNLIGPPPGDLDAEALPMETEAALAGG